MTSRKRRISANSDDSNPLSIVDAHHHLWNLTAVDYPWLRAKGRERFFGDPGPIQHDYEARHLLADQVGFDIHKSVHIQVGTAPGMALDETRWVDDHAARHHLPTALVPFVDFAAEDALSSVDSHLASSARVRGFRQIISRHPLEDAVDNSPALLINPTFARNLRELIPRGLSFDLQLTPPHMLAAARLLGSVDRLKVALCHAGSPWARDATGIAQWRHGLSALAELPTVTCKLSGLGMFDRQWTQASLAPIVETVLEIFGPQRVMWGSNFPVDKLYRSYHDLLSTMLTIVPSSMHDQVFRTTAERFYRI